MKILIFFLILNFFPFISSAQSQQERVVELYPIYHVGDQKKYQIIYRNKNFINAKLNLNNTTIKEIVIRVVSIKDSLIDLEWVYSHVKFRDSIPQHNIIMNFLNTLNSGIKIKYTTNKKGIVKVVANYDEITSKINFRIDSLMEIMAKDASFSKSSINTTQMQLKLMFLTHSQIDDIVINDFFKFHVLYGEEYKVGQVKLISKYKIKEFHVRLDSINAKSNLYHLNSEIETNNISMQTFDFDLGNRWLIKYKSVINTRDFISTTQYYEINKMK